METLGVVSAVAQALKTTEVSSKLGSTLNYSYLNLKPVFLIVVLLKTIPCDITYP